MGAAQNAWAHDHALWRSSGVNHRDLGLAVAVAVPLCSSLGIKSGGICLCNGQGRQRLPERRVGEIR